MTIRRSFDEGRWGAVTSMGMSQLPPECENPESAGEATKHVGNEILSIVTEQSGIQELAEKDGPAPASRCRISGRQRRLSLEEYRSTLLQASRIEDRRPVFVSYEVRDRLGEYVCKLGSRRMSVSGLLENIVWQYLEIYSEDFDRQRKLQKISGAKSIRITERWHSSIQSLPEAVNGRNISLGS